MIQTLKNNDGTFRAIVANNACENSFEYFHNGKSFDAADYCKLSPSEQRAFDNMVDDFEEGVLNYFDGTFAWCHNPDMAVVWNMRSKVLSSFHHKLSEIADIDDERFSPMPVVIVTLDGEEYSLTLQYCNGPDYGTIRLALASGQDGNEDDTNALKQALGEAGYDAEEELRKIWASYEQTWIDYINNRCNGDYEMGDIVRL